MTDWYLIIALTVAVLSGMLIGGLLTVFRINPPNDEEQIEWLRNRDSSKW